MKREAERTGCITVSENGRQRLANRVPEETTPTLSNVLVSFITSPSIILLLCSATLQYDVLLDVLLYLRQLWGESATFCQQLYRHVSLARHNDPFILFVWVTFGLIYLLYWMTAGIYTLLDVSGRPASLRKFKVQPGNNEPPSTRSLLQCVVLVHFNHLVVTLPVLWCSYHLMVARDGDFTPHLPYLTTLIIQLAVFDVVDEVYSYYSHRLIHHRLFYKYIHKIHHVWQSPIAFSTDYGHPLDHLISNVMPLVLGPLLVGSHPTTLWLWVSLTTFTAVAHHSGYNFPFLPSPLFHDYHHKMFNECYGSMGVLDYLHGTDVTFRRSTNYHLDSTIYSIVPPPTTDGQEKVTVVESR